MILYENVYSHYSSTKTNFNELLVVIFCISLNLHILLLLSKFKIFIIKILNDSLYIVLVFYAVFVTVYYVKAVQDDISAKTVPI